MGKRNTMDSVGIAIILLILFQQWTSCAGADTHWTYTGSVGQSQWSEYFPDCGGNKQSPINVETSQTQHDPSLTPMRPLGYRRLGKEPFALRNNGHTVEMSLPDWMGLGGLPWQFTALQLHLHWGSSGDREGGSEHTIDGHRSAAEVRAAHGDLTFRGIQLHVVHYNSELYTNASTAKSRTDGLAVLGVLIEIHTLPWLIVTAYRHEQDYAHTFFKTGVETGDDTNPAFESIISYLGNIKHAGQTVSIPPFDVQSLLPLNLGRYFRYNGSLTTPPCYQSVLWTVFAERVTVSREQLRKLETALFSSPVESHSLPLQDNYRNPQPLNRRRVLASFSLDTITMYSVGEVCAIVIGTLCGCIGLAAIIHFVIKTIRSKETEKEPKQDVVFKTTSDTEKEEATPQPEP